MVPHYRHTQGRERQALPLRFPTRLLRFSDCVPLPSLSPSPPSTLHTKRRQTTYLGGVGLALDVLTHGVDDADALAAAGGGGLPNLHLGRHAAGHGEEGMDGGQGHEEGAGDGDLEHG